MSDYGENRSRRRSSRSLFGPVILIALGVYFLLSNLGMLATPNWTAVFQLWPLWLIFIGVNIIVKSAPRPFGTFLSMMVGITAVAIMGYVLFFADDNPLLARLNVPGDAEIHIETLSYHPEEISRADIELVLSSAGADINKLEDSNDLLAGTVSTTGEVVFETIESGNQATVFLDSRTADGFNWLNPSNWRSSAQLSRWQIGLSPQIDIDLKIDAASGSTSADLTGLTLTFLHIDSASGRFDLTLPEGEYDIDYNAASGSSTIVFPENGRFFVNLDGASGHIALHIPDGMEARVEVEEGSGRFAPDGRFELISGERNGDGVWETGGFDDAANRIELAIKVASGSVSIETP
jgi:hypothetical protein